MSNADEQWHKEFNILDIKHDGTGLLRNNLFIACLTGIHGLYPDAIYEPNITVTDFAGYPALPLVWIGRTKQSHKPSQFTDEGITTGIQDMFPPSTVGLIDEISPSYYFDSASSSYGDIQFDELWKNRTKYNKTINLKKYGINGSFTVLINKPAKSIMYTFAPAAASQFPPFEVTIDCMSGYTTNNGDSYMINGNDSKKDWFGRPRNLRNESRMNAAEQLSFGKKLQFGKLLGDLSHLLYGIPMTGDSWLKDRCIKAEIGVVYREAKAKGVKGHNNYFYYPSNIFTTYRVPRNVDPLFHERSDPDLEGGSPSKKTESCSVEYDRNSKTGHIICNDNDDASKKTQTLNIPTEFFIWHNKCNIKNLISGIDIHVSRLENFLKVNEFKINNVNYKCPENVTKYIIDLIDFLKSDNLRNEINRLEIDAHLKCTEFNSIISKWIPLDIIFNSDDMDTSVHPEKGEVYYTPKKVEKIFPSFDDDIIGFKNGFIGGNFYDFVINSINESLSDDEKIKDVVFTPKKNHGFKDVLAFLHKQENQELDENIKTFHGGIHTQNGHKFTNLLDKAIIYNITNETEMLLELFREIVGENNLHIAHTYYTLLHSLLFFSGNRIYDYNFVVNFVNIIKNEGNGIRFVGGIERLNKIINSTDKSSKSKFSKSKFSKNKTSKNKSKSKSKTRRNASQ